MVPAVLRHQEYRHLYDVRRREPGGLHVELLLLRRVRGEPEEREQRERDDNLTSVLISDTYRSLVCLAIKFAGNRMPSKRVAKNRGCTILNDI